MEKKCTKCGETKPLDQFHKNKAAKDGHRQSCKICAIARTKQWYAENPERHKENSLRWRAENPERHKENNRRWRAENPKRAAENVRRWHLENPERLREHRKTWLEKNPEFRSQANKRYKTKHPQKVKAHRLLNYAVHLGKLIRPDTCSSCGDNGRIEGHHPDYSRPLEVVWVCPPCHKKIHREA